MSWGNAILLRLVSAALFAYFTWCETEGVYEFLMADQKVFNYVVKAGVGFAAAGALLPMFAGVLFNRGQWIAGSACWLVTPIVMSMVLYGAITRTGGTVDQAQLARDRAVRADTVAAKTEAAADKAWQDARDAALRECTSGSVKLQRGGRCLEAETKRDTAWATLLTARKDLVSTPETREDSGAKRVVAIVPWLTEPQVRLYQPLVVPVTMALLASLFSTIMMTLKTPPMPRPWVEWMARRAARKASTAATLPANVSAERAMIDITPEPPSEPKPALPSNVHVLKPRPRPAPTEEPEEELDPTDVIAFLKERMTTVRGEDLDYVDIWPKWEAWCAAQTPPKDPLDPRKLALILNYVSEKAKIAVKRNRGRTYFRNRKLVGASATG